MSELTPSYFFDLSNISFQDLFALKDRAWDPLFSLNKYLNSLPLGKIEVEIPSSVHLENPSQISIGLGCVIEPGSYIKGPCVLGKNCLVRHGAYIRDGVIASDGCVIGHDTEIKHSILLKDVHAAHFAYIGDSILGNSVNLGAGVKCANFRLDQKEIAFWFQGKKVDTGLQKLGSIIGDHCQIGCNSVLNPGTIMGKKTLCYPLMSVQGFIPASTYLKSSFKEEIHD